MTAALSFFAFRILLLVLRFFKSKSFRSPFGRAGYFLDSGRPALRRFAASFAVRAAPVAQCLHKYSTQRNAPRSIALVEHAARQVRVSGRVPLTARPCAGNGMRAIHRAHPCGASSSAAAAMQWGPGEARAARSCAQKQECPFSLSDSFPRKWGKRRFSFPCARRGERCRRQKGALLILIHGSPFAAARA